MFQMFGWATQVGLLRGVILVGWARRLGKPAELPQVGGAGPGQDKLSL